MKYLIIAITVFFTSLFAYAQSTCISRCEIETGIGDSRCPRICKNYPENIKRKKTEKKIEDETPNPTSASASASASASTSTTLMLQTEQTDKKITQPISQNKQTTKENK